MGGGGGGKPLNILKLDRGIDPPEAFNWRLYFAVFSFGIMGAARGMLMFFVVAEIYSFIILVIIFKACSQNNKRRKKKEFLFFSFLPHTN